jgi:hypothetical protein
MCRPYRKRLFLEGMQNRVFFPQAALDLWLSEGVIDLKGMEMSLTREARRYRLLEAAYVLHEVTGAEDINELVGRVKSKQYLQELGAELLESSLILGDNAYEVTPGFLASPIGTFEEFVMSAEHKVRASQSSDPEPRSDEDLLALILAKSSGATG